MKQFLIILSICCVLGCQATNPTSAVITPDTVYTPCVTTEGDTTDLFWRSIITLTDTAVAIVDSTDSVLVDIPQKDEIDWDCLLRITCIE